MSASPDSQLPTGSSQLDPRQRRIIIGVGIGLLLVMAAGVVAIFFMVKYPTTTETIRDIFIIVMALESLIIGAALIVLIVQIAQLTNLLRHEIKPILDSTNETMSTVRGTTIFLSENLVDPVIKLSGYVAGLQQMLAGLNLFRRRN